MFNVLIYCVFGLVASFFLPSIGNAETIILMSGEKIQGRIIEQTELRITVDVQGAPYTYYLGEIASIDGKPVEMPRQKVEENALLDAKPLVIVPHHNDEQDSLVRFMNQRKSAVVSVAPSLPPHVSTAVSPATSGANKSIIATPDGGLIIVDNDKIIKYDKNLQVVKEVNLAGPVLSTTSPPNVSAPVPAPPPATAVSVPQEPEKLKDFLHNLTVDLSVQNKK